MVFRTDTFCQQGWTIRLLKGVWVIWYRHEFFNPFTQQEFFLLETCMLDIFSPCNMIFSPICRQYMYVAFPSNLSDFRSIYLTVYYTEDSLGSVKHTSAWNCCYYQFTKLKIAENLFILFINSSNLLLKNAKNAGLLSSVS